MARRPDDRPPSLAMVAAGGLGVLAVVAFVAAVAFGARTVPPAPGQRIALTQADGGSGLAVLVARCPAERVRSVELLDGDGAAVWRITSRKGSIDERYVVGAPAPTGFETAVEAGDDLPEELLEARVAIERDDELVRDRQRVELPRVPADAVRYQGQEVGADAFAARSLAAIDCSSGTGSDRELASWLFVVGAAAVVATYAGMVGRWWRGSRRR